MKRRDLERVLVSLGGTVEERRGTGELFYRHPSMSWYVTTNGRRKDAALVAVKFVSRAYDIVKGKS